MHFDGPYLPSYLSSPENPKVEVFDTRYEVPGKRIEGYASALGTFVPTHARNSEELEARLERVHISGATINVISASCHNLVRVPNVTQPDNGKHIIVLAIMAGCGAIQVANSRLLISSADLIIIDDKASITIYLAEAKTQYKLLYLVIPSKDLLPFCLNSEAEFMLLNSSKIVSVILDCLINLSNTLAFAPPDHIRGLYLAFLSLLPLVKTRPGDESTHPLLGKMQRYVIRCLSCPDLSVREIAHHFGVSTRYVHKLFFQSGSSLSAYIRNARLDCIYSDLAVPFPSIAVIAFRWGFTDLSSFNRAFKRRFGIVPTEARRGLNLRREREVDRARMDAVV